MKSGQILIIVLLIVVVALAVGLSIASRNITNIRTSTQTEQSQRAFTAAEGGVEDVLSKFSQVRDYINTGTGAPSGCSIPTTGQASCDVAVGSLTAKVNVAPSTTYEARINTGQVAQINLKDAQLTYGVSSVKISWSKRGTPEIQIPRAAIEITFVCQAVPCMGNTSAAASGYAQERFAFTLNTGVEQGFTSCPGSSGVATAASPGENNFDCTITFPLNNTGNNGGQNVILARVRPFHQSTAVVPGTTVGGSGNVDLPIQQYDVTSLVTTDTGIARRVKVTRTTLPILPAVFDFSLYSQGPIAK